MILYELFENKHPPLTHNILSAIIRITVKHWLVDDVANSAEEISNGHCGDFADNVWNKLGCPPDEVLYFSSCYAQSCGHTWLTFRGKHYDAECPDGVSDWKMLPFWQRDAILPDSTMRNPKAELDIPGAHHVSLQETKVIAYHGTGDRFDAFLDRFRPNFFTTDIEYAKGYMGGKTFTNLIDKPKKRKNYILKCEITYNNIFNTKIDSKALQYYNEKFIPYINALNEKYNKAPIPQLKAGEMVSFIYADYLWGFMRHEEDHNYDALLVDEGGSSSTPAIVPFRDTQIKILKRQIIK